MAAGTATESEQLILECRDPTQSQQPTSLSQISISTAQISSWDFSTILNHQILTVHTSRARLMEESSYFQSLLSGNFSESTMRCISIQWNLEVFLHVLSFLHGCHLEVTFRNFPPLYDAAVYFGLERLILKCKMWLHNISKAELSSSQQQLTDLHRIWEFGCELAIDWIVELCTSCVAKNFMCAMSCDTFVDLPYSFLVSCVEHPHLTVDSERHLCEALLAWVSANVKLQEQRSTGEDFWSDNSKLSNITNEDWKNLLKRIRADLLPLWFTFGKVRCHYFSGIAKQGIAAACILLQKAPKDSTCMVNGNEWSRMKIRLTNFSKKLDLSGCPQVTSACLLLSLLPDLYSPAPLLEGLPQKSYDVELPLRLSHLPIMSFEAMLEIDISKCAQLHIGAAIECFRKSFPFLRKIKMTHFLDFETKKLCQLIEKCSMVCEVDLTVDVSPLLSSNVSVLYSQTTTKRLSKNYFDMPSCHGAQQSLANITKLTLEGRTDFSDYELHKIAEFCISLRCLNILGCLLITDTGIASFILRCRQLHSIIATDTSFGRNSISALCSLTLDAELSCVMEMDQNCPNTSGIDLQMLHIGCCKGVTETCLVEILSRGHLLKSLCLRDTCLDDQALCSFSGSSLEMLDVSNTKISGVALSHVISRNPGLKCLEAKGCRNLLKNPSKHEVGHSTCPYNYEELFHMLGRTCKLEGLAIGWSFSFSSLDAVQPALCSLKAVNVGLGGSLGPEGLIMLCSLCPFLESVTLLFQEVSDIAVMKVMKTLRNLRSLSFCYCIGDISPLTLKHNVPNLRKLKLERVTPWMTNHDLRLLTKNCTNLTELSLVGCTQLDADAQLIISAGWPGLISLRLEDCGAVTENGIGFLYDCKAMEELLLRHNGRGITRGFLLDAASKLPMLRSISLDWCDASEGDFDLPHFSNRHSLASVKISRCKLWKCALEFHNTEAQRRPVHEQTLVLLWNSTSLQRVVVKERIT